MNAELWSEGNNLIRRSYLENCQLHKGIFEISETDIMRFFRDLYYAKTGAYKPPRPKQRSPCWF